MSNNWKLPPAKCCREINHQQTINVGLTTIGKKWPESCVRELQGLGGENTIAN
jgi:hypothetical protein